MIRVLMCGPLADSGGVSNHTKNLLKEIPLLKTELLFYNFNNGDSSNSKISYIKRTYRRTFGLLYESFSKRKHYSIIHLQTSGGFASFLSSITGSFVSIILNKKLIITFHHSNTEQFVDKYIRSFGFVLKSADRMILVSEKQKQYISNILPLYQEKLTTIPNGYDENLYYIQNMEKCRNKLGLPLDKKIVYNISNLIDVKGHKYLIDAMNEVVKNRSDVLCIIVGKGYLKSKLKEQIRSNNLQDYVKLLGWKPDEEVPLYMNACDFFVHASFKEGNPTVMFECLSCGKPYVGTAVGGVPEIINSEDYGLLVEPGDVKGLVKIIEAALNKEWDTHKIRLYGTNFTWRNIALETVNVYNTVSK